MRVYTFHLRKGGDGKTTLTGNVAWGLAKRGVRVCMVDCDTQANLSKWFASDRGEYELADYFEGRTDAAGAILPIAENLDMIVTARRYSELDEWEKAKLQDRVFVFRKLVRDLKTLGYDIVFFDLPPTFTTLHSRVYLAVDEVIASSSPSLFSEEGLERLATDLADVNEDFEVNVRYQKLVLGNIDRRKKGHRERVDDILSLREDGYQVFLVPTSSAFSNSQENPLGTVYDMKDATPARNAIEEIVDAIEGDIYGEVEAQETLQRPATAQ